MTATAAAAVTYLSGYTRTERAGIMFATNITHLHILFAPPVWPSDIALTCARHYTLAGLDTQTQAAAAARTVTAPPVSRPPAIATWQVSLARVAVVVVTAAQHVVGGHNDSGSDKSTDSLRLAMAMESPTVPQICIQPTETSTVAYTGAGAGTGMGAEDDIRLIER